MNTYLKQSKPQIYKLTTYDTDKEIIRDLESKIDLMKGDIKPVVDDVLRFLNDLTSPEMYGHAIPLEVRKRAVDLRDSIKNSYLID